MRALFDDARRRWPQDHGRIPHPNGLHEEAVALVRRPSSL